MRFVQQGRKLFWYWKVVALSCTLEKIAMVDCSYSPKPFKGALRTLFTAVTFIRESSFFDFWQGSEYVSYISFSGRNSFVPSQFQHFKNVRLFSTVARNTILDLAWNSISASESYNSHNHYCKKMSQTNWTFDEKKFRKKQRAMQVR